MDNSWKEWEKPVLDLEEGVAKLKELADRERDAVARQSLEARIEEFEARIRNFIEVRYSRLGPWQKVLLARAEPRPYTLDYIGAIFREFTELDGDRRYGQDHAIIGGPARFGDLPVMIVGHQKGRNIQDRAYRNFAMAKPEGYRKAIRLFEMADRFRMPIITFIDTPAADPGLESESRGISEAIAASMLKMFELRVPVVSIVIGEGGSGGAIGIAVANQVYMQEHAVYSVIPPEGCAAILWRDPNKKAQASAALQLTAESALHHGLIDGILPEPFGGAHRDLVGAAETIRTQIESSLAELAPMDGESLRQHRHDRFRDLGTFGQT